MYGDSGDSWIDARAIWNEHTYHITNVLADGTIPQEEQPNWLVPGLEPFSRQHCSRADNVGPADLGPGWLGPHPPLLIMMFILD